MATLSYISTAEDAIHNIPPQICEFAATLPPALKMSVRYKILDWLPISEEEKKKEPRRSGVEKAVKFYFRLASGDIKELTKNISSFVANGYKIEITIEENHKYEWTSMASYATPKLKRLRNVVNEILPKQYTNLGLIRNLFHDIDADQLCEQKLYDPSQNQEDIVSGPYSDLLKTDTIDFISVSFTLSCADVFHNRDAIKEFFSKLQLLEVQ